MPQLLHTEESPFNLLFKSAPLLIFRGVVISSLQFFAKRAIYAQADESMLAAYGIYSTIEGFIFLMIFRGLRIISAKVAHLHAKEMTDSAFKPEELGILYRQGVLFGCTLMIPTVIFCVGAPTIFRLTGQSEAVIQNSRSYFLWGFLSYLGDMLYRSSARRDVGRLQPIYPLLGDICESGIDAAGTYIFVNGKLGFPKMGVNGGAIAYALAAWTTAILYNLRAYFDSNLKKYQLYNFTLSEYKNTVFNPEFKEIVLGGLHIAAKFSIVYITIALTTFLCGLEGPGAVVGLQAAVAYSNLIVLPIGGFSDAASVVVGRLFKKNWHNTRIIGNFTILVSCLFSCICATVLLKFINPIARLFAGENAVNTKDFNTVKNFLQIQAIMEIVNSVGNPSASVLSGCLETRYPFLLSVSFIFALNTVLASVTHFIFHQDATKMYAVQLAGLILTSTGVLMRWIKQHKIQKNNALSNDNPPIIVYQTTRSIWQMRDESPRHAQVNDLPPAEVSCAIRV